MAELTKNGKRALKLIFTDYKMDYNSNILKDKLGLSNAGSLKLLRSLREQKLLIDRKMGKSIFYKINLENEYAMKVMELILMEHGEMPTFTRGWIEELRPLGQHAKAMLLFGSLLKKGKEAGDVDVCFVLNSMKRFDALQAHIGELNRKNRLRIHPLFLPSPHIFEMKLKENDPPIVDMVKSCIVLKGVETFVEVLKHAQA